MCQLLYLANPCTLGACLGNNWSSLEECCVMIAIMCAANKSSWAAAAALAVAAHMSVHQIYMVVPLAVLVSEERRVVSTALAFGIQAALLCGLVACLSALLAVHLGATVPQWLDSTYGFMLRADDLTPSMGLWWYFFAEIFDHFRAFFLFVFHVQPALLLIPLTMRTRHTPLSLVLTTCLLITLFKPFPCVADLALCSSLVPLALYELRQLPSLFVVGCALAVAFTMHPVLLDLWVERFTGNANFVLATTIVHALAITTLVVDVAFVSTSRGSATHKKTL